MAKPDNKSINGVTTSVEKILLNNKNANSHPELASKLTQYSDVIANNDYQPPEEVIQAILELNPADSTALANLEALMVQLQESGLILAIVSNGAGESANISIDENSAEVTAIEAVDPQDDPVIYSIVGGEDATLFAINPDTGLLSFANAPDFEVPGDFDTDNVYEVTVQALDSDSGQTDTQVLSISVTDILEGPVIDEYVVLEGSHRFYSGGTNNTHIEDSDSNNTISGDSGRALDGRTSSNPEMGDDVINGNGGRDTLYGDAQFIHLWDAYGDYSMQAGNDIINGGSDDDYIYGDAPAIEIKNAGGSRSVDGSSTILLGDDVLSGGSGDDEIIGDGGMRVYNVSRGDFTIQGGNDILNGDEGSDILVGDAEEIKSGSWGIGVQVNFSGGDDTINGGSGDDNMWGDAQTIALVNSDGSFNFGADTFIFQDQSGNDTIHDFQAGYDTISISGYNLNDFGDLAITESGGNSIIQFDIDNSVELVDVINLDTSDFLFI